MKALIRYGIVLLLCVTHLVAQDLDSLQRSFMTKYDQVNASRDAKVEVLIEGYLGALDRLKKQLQTTGQLELVLQAQHEIEVIGKDTWPPEELGEKATSELKTLRSKYVDAREKVHKDHATQLNDVFDKMEKLLTTQIVDLTKAGKIEDAKLAQKMKDDLGKNVALTEARRLIKGNASGGDEGWINLWEMKEKWTAVQIINGTEFYKNDKPDLKLDKKRQAESIFAHASSTFEYNLDYKISKLRCGLWLPGTGDVTYIVKADGVEISRKNVVGPTTEVMLIEIDFKPAKKIEFITDMNGNIAMDWSTWVSPQVK